MSDPSTTGTERSRWVCIDLFSGLGGFSQAFEEADRWEVYTVDVEEQFDPDLRADVLDLRPADLALVGLDREEIDVLVILASPPCTDFSMAASRYERFVDGEPQTESARESVALVYHTLGLIHALAPDYWFLENPQGYLRQVIREPAGRVTYCQFGTEYMKPTDLWGDHPQGLTYRSCSYGDGCHAFNTDQENGGQGNARDAWRDDVGDKVRDPAERAKVPGELSRAIREAVEDEIENPPPEQQTLVTNGGYEIENDYVIEVTPAPAPQTIECPGCDSVFKELIQEGRVVVSGGTCPDCDAWIRYDRGRGEGEKEDDTEQTTLMTDGGVDESGTERSDRARFECSCGASEEFPKESFAKLHWLAGRFGYKNIASAIDDIRDCCDRPDYMEVRGWEELREDDDGLRADGSGETGTERLERFCATCGSTDLSTASVREGTYECGGCGHVIGRTHVRRVGGDRGV